MKKQHRDSQKRYYEQNAVYFVTTVTFERYPYFKEKIFCELLILDLRLSQQLKDFELWGYAILPEHVHLLIQPMGEFNIAQIMHNIKRNFSRNSNKVILNEPLYSPEGDNTDCRRNLHNHIIPNDDTYCHQNQLHELKQRFVQKYTSNHNIPKFKWQKSYRDHILRNELDLRNHQDYVWFNPVKHGLCVRPEDYEWIYIKAEDF